MTGPSNIHPNGRYEYRWQHRIHGRQADHFSQPGREAEGWLHEQSLDPDILWAEVADLATGEVVCRIER
jgi:hypothetical protein